MGELILYTCELIVIYVSGRLWKPSNDHCASLVSSKSAISEFVEAVQFVLSGDNPHTCEVYSVVSINETKNVLFIVAK